MPISNGVKIRFRTAFYWLCLFFHTLFANHKWLNIYLDIYVKHFSFEFVYVCNKKTMVFFGIETKPWLGQLSRFSDLGKSINYFVSRRWNHMVRAHFCFHNSGVSFHDSQYGLNIIYTELSMHNALNKSSCLQSDNTKK